jgi:hypothetical protein
MTLMPHFGAAAGALRDGASKAAKKNIEIKFQKNT